MDDAAMEARTDRSYASYVVRVWTRGLDDDADVRVRVERVDSGELVDVHGDAARRLAAMIEAAIRVASGAPRSPDRPREAVGPGSDLPSRRGA
jgi:hypothetical protein